MTQATQIKFGTDGWRAIMGEAYTMENVERLAQAFADYLNKNYADGSKIAVGYDYRENSENFAARFASILQANGIRVSLSDSAVPTPAVSRKVINDKATAGIAITASHNPGAYNGVKIKDANGSSADASITRAVEAFIDESPVKRGNDEEVVAAAADFLTDYLDGVKNYLKLDSFGGYPLNILIDSMHGVGAFHIQEILKPYNLNVTTLRGNRDITFGGTAPEPIAKNFPDAVKEMQGNSFDAGFVTDGDADRIGAVRPGGDFVSPGKLLSLIMLHMVEDLGMKGDVVTTVSNTALIGKVAKSLGLNIHETPVGFKYIVDIMQNNDVLIAGEESGGLAFKNYMPERDGILSALLIIQMMQMRKKSFVQLLDEMEGKYGRFIYSRIDMTFQADKRSEILEAVAGIDPGNLAGLNADRVNKLDGTKFEFDDGTWLLFRMSGTEPLLRIYSESPQEGVSEKLTKWGEELAVQAQK